MKGMGTATRQVIDAPQNVSFLTSGGRYAIRTLAAPGGQSVRDYSRRVRFQRPRQVPLTTLLSLLERPLSGGRQPLLRAYNRRLRGSSGKPWRKIAQARQFQPVQLTAIAQGANCLSKRWY